MTSSACGIADDSRGAHFREDFPQVSDLAASTYISVRLNGGAPQVTAGKVAFTRVRPGQSLLDPAPDQQTR